MAKRTNFRPERPPTKVEWGMLAAFIDGEGSIIITHSPVKNKQHWSPHYSLVVRVTNSDPRLPLWCQKVFGGFITNKARKAIRPTSKRALFQWGVASDDAEWVIRGCLPFFIIKKDQAEVGIAFRRTFPKRKYGKLGVPESVISQRRELKLKIEGMKRTSHLDGYDTLHLVKNTA